MLTALIPRPHRAAHRRAFARVVLAWREETGEDPGVGATAAVSRSVTPIGVTETKLLHELKGRVSRYGRTGGTR